MRAEFQERREAFRFRVLAFAAAFDALIALALLCSRVKALTRAYPPLRPTFAK